MKRGGRIKPKKRSPEERQRIYGSDARIEWIKSQPCLICDSGPSENAHTENGGTGYKAGFETIVPLCHKCHQDFDQHRLSKTVRDFVKWSAPKVQAAWLLVEAVNAP